MEFGGVSVAMVARAQLYVYNVLLILYKCMCCIPVTPTADAEMLPMQAH